MILSAIIIGLISGCNNNKSNGLPSTSPTAHIENGEQKLLKIYKGFLETEIKDKRFVSKTENEALSYEDFSDAFLIDVDNDKNNELVTLYKHKQYILYKIVIFKYENGKVNNLIELDGYRGKGYEGYSIAEDKQGVKYIINNGYNGSASDWSEWYTLSEFNGGKLETKDSIKFTKELVYKENKPTNEWSYKFIQNDTLTETGVMTETDSTNEYTAGKYLIEKEKMKSLKILFDGERFESYNKKGEGIK